MKTLKKTLIITIALVLLSFFHLQGQPAGYTPYPKIGDVVANHEFTDLDNYPETSLKISDFRGQWLIVDFWSRYCTGCIASFPRMNDLHLKYGDNVKIIMAGLEYTKSGEQDEVTRSIYQRMKSMHDLQFTVAFDNMAREKYDIGALPHIYVIDPAGVLIAKTISINEEQIQRLLDGDIPRFRRSFSASERIDYDKDLPLLTNGTITNGGMDTAFTFRSMLMPFDKNNMPVIYAGFNDKRVLERGRLEVVGVPLDRLFLLAFTGKMTFPDRTPEYNRYYRKVMLELRDTSHFVVDNSSFDGYYAYSLSVPAEKSSEAYMRSLLKSDLERYVDCKATLENREVPVYNIVVVDSIAVNKLKTKYDKADFILHGSKYEGHSYRNLPLEEIARGLFYLTTTKENARIPVFDRTGIDFNVDITVAAEDMTSLDSINQELAKHGLQIIQTLEKMDVIVVRDNDDKAIL